MIYDGHTHIRPGTPNPTRLLCAMDEAGVSKCILFSIASDRTGRSGKALRDFNRMRLENLIEWTCESERLVPVYFMNPLEPDAEKQADEAIEAGAVGFKVICSDHFPGDEGAIPTYHHIAARGKPILFHSGILWDQGPNANFNRPGNFEELLRVPRLRFALAHVGWPWCDEMIAVFGKFLAMEDRGYSSGQQMYIDLTPGTPPIYRREVLTKLLTVGYRGMEKRLIFGLDNTAEGYNTAWSRQWIDRDTAIYEELGLDSAVITDIFCGNCRSFWGID